MTETNFEKVVQFTKAFNLPQASSPAIPKGDLHKLRVNLIFEEMAEFLEAAAQNNIAKTAKELADVLYVVYGYAATMGIDIDYAFQLVHEANMTKLDEMGNPVTRSDGKVIKGPKYKPVDEVKLIRSV
jgi:predicted HAD superfamily Cof-like phosphohydrolase